MALELLAETAALIPRSDLEVVPGRGHVTVLWAPAYTTGAVRFLDAA